MGYVLRVRLASFFTGAATASFLGLYILYKDYKVAHESIAQQFSLCFKVRRLHEPLDRRISALESLKQGETSQHVEATE
ncbi:hypothetical protein J1N35_011245 [Gossypium stocksii]|uniref:Uncharacterized protein n=1 Tax=Gossypium stocksii TaxID=47602 RepID=A0A9D3W359_9ROSI|nr:hypothetical protein J1N35_011245 [Gossypium stocksii]